MTNRDQYIISIFVYKNVKSCNYLPDSDYAREFMTEILNTRGILDQMSG